MMLQKTIFPILLILFSVNASWGQVVAVVGDKKITLKEFQTKYDEVKQQSINPPSPEVFLEDLVRFELGVQEAEKRNLRKDPIVQERFKQELYKALLEKSLGDQINKINVTENEMRAYYKKNPELRTSHILIEIKPDATKAQRNQAKKRALEIYSEVKKSKRPFENLVKLYSDDSLSKAQGGDIGYQTRMTVVPPYYETALKMKVGQVRGLVETQYGFHIVKLTGKRAYQQANKRQIRAAVFDEKRKQVFDKFFAQLKKKYSIKTDSGAVKKVK